MVVSHLDRQALLLITSLQVTRIRTQANNSLNLIQSCIARLSCQCPDHDWYCCANHVVETKSLSTLKPKSNRDDGVITLMESMM